MSWQDEVDEIEKRRSMAHELGGESAIARHRGRGELTIRERIDALLDPGSFREHGPLAGGALLDDKGRIDEFTPANYVLGLGLINARRVAVGGEDFTVRGGSPNAAGLRKSVYAEHLAIQYRVPLVRMLEGGGGSVGDANNDWRQPRTVGVSVHEAPRFQVIADAMGEVPVASAALGPVAGFPAGRLVASHFSVMVRGISQVMTGGPALVQRALGDELSKEQLGGAEIHEKSGLVDYVADTEQDALNAIRRFVTYMPSSVDERAPRVNCDDPVDRREAELLKIVPRNRRRAFNMRKLVELVVDRGSFLPLALKYGPSILCGLARMGGQSVGITANDCRYYAGAMTAEAAQKMRRLIELCDTFGLPIINFVDEPGFMIGLDAERAGTIRYGMAAVAAAAQARVPWASVRVHKSFGVAGAAHFGPNAYKLDWPSAAYGPLPIEGGVAVAYRREIEAAADPEAKRREIEDRLELARSPFRPAESFAAHDIIDPRDTRPRLCEWIDWIQPHVDAIRTGPKFAMRP